MEITSTNVLVVILIVVLICCFIVWMNESNDSQSTSDGGNNVIVSTRLDKEGNIILIPGRSSDPQKVSGMTLLGVYGNENNSELVDGLEVSDGSEYKSTIIYSVPVKNVKKGDVFQATAVAEAATTIYDSDEEPINIMFAKQIFVTEDNSAVEPRSSQYEVTEANGSNINHDQHYFITPSIGWWVADKDYDVLYFKYRMYAASNYIDRCDPQVADSDCRVDIKQDYGRMTVAQFRSV